MKTIKFWKEKIIFFHIGNYPNIEDIQGFKSFVKEQIENEWPDYAIVILSENGIDSVDPIETHAEYLESLFVLEFLKTLEKEYELDKGEKEYAKMNRQIDKDLFKCPCGCGAPSDCYRLFKF